ncbi:copper amine oxidase N-terminal domain-containing protein [Paratissierella segnis]|jgi:hypothetical protein|uniref:Copper amine oxidase N-terminal domain-containing protein n=1 Tax=Paratissierella segnis TaxID=2763679 RepID=A0A926IKB8_9FIRM|nr:copper amine oxidase N-terminal domain-containing protein [Paratissierella segnis]MBC8587548.1 copper amine oxidase N-terminal domain-containing protein [Paratissierella segnis]
MKKNYKKMSVVVAVMIFVISITSISLAAPTAKNLKAYYNNIRVFRNGSQVSISTQPFIVDGTTYVPLRAISELLEKDVTWDQSTYTVGINDKPGSSSTELYNQIYNYQLQISQLESKIKDLESKLDKKEESSSMTIKELQKQLNKDYGTYKKIDFDINLTEKKSSITVKIYFDDEKFYDLDDKYIESFVEDIVDDITDEFEDMEISGYIEDDYTDEEVVTFSVNSKGKLSVDIDF